METLNWSVLHDPKAVCRAEAIRALFTLNAISEDTTTKETLFTSLMTDKSADVKREAEHALVKSGILSSSVDEQQRKDKSLFQAYPFALAGKTSDEVEISLRSELISQKELDDVIDQLKVLGSKENIMEKVQSMIEAEGETGISSIDYEALFEPHIEVPKKNLLNRKIKKSVNEMERALKLQGANSSRVTKVLTFCDYY